MNEFQPADHRERSAGWAPDDYTDGKRRGEWESPYPPKARKHIRLETAYLLILTIVSLVGVFWVLKSCGTIIPGLPTENVPSTDDNRCIPFLVSFGALCSGILGGCCFGIKSMYHFVAKLQWHEDRRLWRILSPLVSGVVSLFMVFLVASGLLQIFDNRFIEHPIRVMAFSFLTGYFSDKALAKMAEVADTLFGGAKKNSDDEKADKEKGGKAD